MAKDFEQVAHTADIKIRVYGDTKKQLFEHALIGMFQVIGPRIPGCKVYDGRLICNELPCQQSVDVRSYDVDALLVDFLSEALCLSDIYNEAYLAVSIHECSDTYISATLYGARVEGFEVVEIKAVTYHDLHIEQIDGLWQTDIVFDI